VRDRFEDSLVKLTQNFRSVPAVIGWVNALFAERFQTAGSERQAPFEVLTAARPSIVGTPTVYRIGGARPCNAEEFRAEEAEVVVALLRQIRDEGWRVREGEGTRPARLEDVAILSRARTGVRGIVEALEVAAIPHRVESRTQVFESQEVRDLIAILRAIDDPTDEIALVAALRSPAFACGDDDLVRWYAGGGRWDFRRELPGDLGESPVAPALTWLRGQHERRWWVPLTRLVDDVVADCRLFELALVDRRPRERWQRLRFVAEQGRSHAERPEATLRSLIDWLEWQTEQGAQVQERVVPEPDDDAVRIMTIHASKGLEFPIVLLVGLGTARYSQSSSVLWGDDGALQVNLGGKLRSAGHEAAQETNRQLEDLEQERLLYVAMTRAQDHLVLSLFHKQPAPNSKAAQTQAEQIAAFAGQHEDLCPELIVELDRSAPADARPVSTLALEADGDREAWQTARQALIDGQKTRQAISATTLAREQAELKLGADAELDAALEKDSPVEELPAWRRGRAGTAIGRAVHSALQTIDIATGENLEAIAAAQAAAEGVADRTTEVARLTRAALDSDAVRKAVAADRYWREVYVAKDFDGLIVDGFIDLLYDTPDGYVVVDYKTDSVGAHNVDDVLARYRPQALAYAFVLSEQLERPVARCEFVFVSAAGGAVTRAVEVSAAALAELRGAMEGAAR
jgi:ATP-dependent helicase/nuclease subunit A